MMSFIRIVGPQVAVQADGVRFIIFIGGNLDAKTCIVYADLTRQSLQLTDRSNIRGAGTVGYIGNTPQGTCFTDRYIGICHCVCQIGFDFFTISCLGCAKICRSIGIRTDGDIAIIGAGTITNGDGCALDIWLCNQAYFLFSIFDNGLLVDQTFAFRIFCIRVFCYCIGA